MEAMGWASNGSHGRMRILERDAEQTVLLTPPPSQSMPPISAPVVAQAKRTHALPRPFEARLVVDGKQFAMRAEPMGGIGQYRLRIWAGTPDGQWKLLEGPHSDQTWDALADPLSVVVRVIATKSGYRM